MNQVSVEEKRNCWDEMRRSEVGTRASKACESLPAEISGEQGSLDRECASGIRLCGATIEGLESGEIFFYFLNLTTCALAEYFLLCSYLRNSFRNHLIRQCCVVYVRSIIHQETETMDSQY
jgi:hypothetical protein